PGEGDEGDPERDVRGERLRRREGEPQQPRGEDPDERRDDGRTPRPPGDRRDGDEEEHAEDDVEPEDRPPVRDGEHRRPEEGAEDRAELLHRTDDAERHPPPSRRPEVGDERERRRDEPTATDALDDPTGDQDVEVDRERGGP